MVCGHVLHCSRSQNSPGVAVSVFNRGKCEEPFKRSQGEGCAGSLDCKADLYCNLVNGPALGICDSVADPKLFNHEEDPCCTRGLVSGPCQPKGVGVHTKSDICQYIDSLQSARQSRYLYKQLDYSKLLQCLQDSSCQVADKGYQCHDSCEKSVLMPNNAVVPKTQQKCMSTMDKQGRIFISAAFSTSPVLVVAMAMFALQSLF